MRIIETKLPGVYVIELERLEDSRGFFARSFCGTVRGMHFQRPPASETKLVRCTRGTIYDVVVDLREDSATFRRHLAVTLSAEERNALYIPERFAHGFQTLEDDTEVFYQMGNYYSPGAAAGLRFDDPKLGIEWPLPASSISEKDLAWPLLQS
ncbi:MAG: dTDP-4-dehydrorhamnose 3,5-epimerase [Verrucomicrobia bacterium]|nr:MAG: dTDP-4-dehydrorhamnose 3,5-epimerase [Verrucomicrobiota bacterium]